MYLGGGFILFIIFIPNLGEMIQLWLAHSFQMGGSTTNLKKNTSIFQRVLFEPLSRDYRHPLSSIQQPLEDSRYQVYGSWSRYMAPGIWLIDLPWKIKIQTWKNTLGCSSNLPQTPTSNSDLVASDRFNIEMPIFSLSWLTCQNLYL